MKIEDIEKELWKFGLVKTCKIVKDSIVTIIITDGFNTKVTSTFSFLDKCLEFFPEYQKVETLITEENLAIVVLTK